MAHKPITETAFITQFAKLRRVEFYPRTIEFHKDEKRSSVNNALFTGPWLVSNMLLEEIIKRKKLRVTNVRTVLCFEDREACELGTNASSLEAFCALFLGKKVDITDDYDLAIKKLDIHEHPKDIKKNFEAIHAINSKELVIDTFGRDLFSACSSLPRSQITANKTIKITVESAVLEIDKFVISNAMSYANSVIKICPNLTTLHFDIINFYAAKDYFDKLNTILGSFINEFLKPLDNGHSELKICLAWTGHWELRRDEDFPQDHELSTIGKEFTTEEDPHWGTVDIARIIKVADAKGREHECILKFFIRIIDDDMSESDSNQDSSDDNSSDFDDYTDSDGDDEEDMDMN